MSKEYENRDPLEIAKAAERDLDTAAAKEGHRTSGKDASDSLNESGVNESVDKKFPGAEVTAGSAASGAGDNRDIPASEGGGTNPATGQTYKARDFEGPGGPEDKAEMLKETDPGNDAVRDNIRQGYREG